MPIGITILYVLNLILRRLLQALQGISTDSKLLIEIFVSHSMKQRTKIKTAYDLVSRKDLLSDVKEQLGGMFCEVMVGLVSPHSRLSWIFFLINRAVE